jgi:hypothetical protein
MMDRIFPERLDGDYRGHRSALWIFFVITFMKVAMGAR